MSPNPTPLPTYLSIIRPLQLLVWALILASLIAMPFVLNWFVLVESQNVLATQEDVNHWLTLKKCSWYCFGVLLGESVTRETKRINAFRYLKKTLTNYF